MDKTSLKDLTNEELSVLSHAHSILRNTDLGDDSELAEDLGGLLDKTRAPLWCHYGCDVAMIVKDGYPLCRRCQADCNAGESTLRKGGV